MIRPKSQKEFLKLFFPGGDYAEIGVFRGAFSQLILDTLCPRRLWLVDLWAEPIDWLLNGELVTVLPQEAYLRACRHEANKAVRIRRQRSTEFLATLPDESLDMIYLDADHAYASVRDELALAWPRIRPGGWLAGHDYCTLFPGVMRAVQEFRELHKLPLDVLTDLPPDPVFNGNENQPKMIAYNSFAIQKPKP